MKFISPSTMPGLEEASRMFHPFKIISGIVKPEGHASLCLIAFDSSEELDETLGLFVWNNHFNIFEEEPGELEDYDLTEESLLNHYPSFSSDLQEWKEFSKLK